MSWSKLQLSMIQVNQRLRMSMGLVVIPVGIGGLGDLDVDCFAQGVLRGIDATDLDIELGTSVAGADDDGLACEGTEGLKDGLAELLKRGDVLCGAGVDDTVGLCGSRALELCEGEVRGKV